MINAQVTKLGLAIGGLLTLSGILAPLYPPFEMTNHFRPWIMLGCAVLIVLQLSTKSRVLWPWISALTALNLALFAVPLSTQAGTAARDNQETLKLVSMNVWSNNRRISDVSRFLETSDADIVVLQELPKRNADVLLPSLSKTYPHRLVCNRCRNLAILSKREWLTLEEHPIDDERPGMIAAEFSNKAGGKFKLVVLHPAYPLRPFEQARNYVWLTSWLSRQQGPLIAVGDFNLTPWSWKMWHLQNATGLVRHGTWQTSWSAQLPLQTFLIDNVLTTPSVKSVSFATGPNLGSDHLPIIATLALP